MSNSSDDIIAKKLLMGNICETCKWYHLLTENYPRQDWCKIRAEKVIRDKICEEWAELFYE